MDEDLETKSRAKEFCKGLLATLPFSLPLILGTATGIGNYVNTGNAEYGLAGFCTGTAVYGCLAAAFLLGSVTSGD